MVRKTAASKLGGKWRKTRVEGLFKEEWGGGGSDALWYSYDCLEVCIKMTHGYRLA